ncbi:ricin-type beta-trefoil lectin domain protein [Streptomyces sp. NPDC001770]
MRLFATTLIVAALAVSGVAGTALPAAADAASPAISAGAGAAAPTPLRLMPLGDSITWGQGSSTGNGYREPLRSRLVAGGHSTDFVGTLQNGVMSDPDNEGHSGWTIDGITSIADGTLTRSQPNVVTLEIGTNDMNLGNSPSTAAPRLGALIDRILSAAPHATVLVGTLILSTSPTVQGNRPDFDRQVPGVVQARQAAGKHVRLVDLNSLTAADLADSLHPNDSGYQKMATAFYGGVQAADADGWITPPSVIGGPVRSGIAGTCLNAAAGSSANGTTVDSRNCDNSGGQSWTVYADGTIRALGKCLDLTGLGTANGTKAEIWDCNGGTNQRWEARNGALVNPASGRCLDIPGGTGTDGTPLVLWDCNGGTNQQWTPPARTGLVHTALLGWMCLDAFGASTANGTAVDVWGCGTAGNQQWSYEGGTLANNGKCLDVNAAGTANGTPVQLWDCNGTGAQQWRNTGGTLVNTASGKCLDVPGGSTAQGTRLVIWDCGNGANQRWTLPA